MEAGVACFDETMCDVDTLAKQVNGSLADKRSQIDTLVRSRRLLKRLEFLFELPKKLEVAVSEGRHEDAVALYESADAVLSSHGHVASLRDIHDDARRIVRSQGRPQGLMTHWRLRESGGARACSQRSATQTLRRLGPRRRTALIVICVACSTTLYETTTLLCPWSGASQCSLISSAGRATPSAVS